MAKIFEPYTGVREEMFFDTERGTIIGERGKERKKEKEGGERKRERETKPGGESQAMSPLWHASRRRACK